MFDLTDIVNFADDNFCVESDKVLSVLISNLEMRLEMITKWLKDSGLVVNESKTEVCLFHANDQPLIQIRLQDVLITSKKSMNVLGVMFDSKLNWQTQTNHAIAKAKKALFGLKAISKFFNFNEMRMLLDSYFYSILYYNSNIWLNSILSPEYKQKLLSISAYALRTCLRIDSIGMSFVDIHKTCKKCTPAQILTYNQAIQLYKIINSKDFPNTFEEVTVVDQIICTGRQLKFKIFRNNHLKIGMNTTANKLHCVSDLIGLDLLNLGFLHFKKLAKIQFLKFGKT